MSTHNVIPRLVEELADLLRERGGTLATVESCTGGLVGAAITERAGISDVYMGGFVTYSNMAKQTTVGVNAMTLAQYGAVSSQVAIEMAKGGCGKLSSTNAIAITGIAGPTGSSIEKPVGTVWICVAQSTGEFCCRRFVFPADRTAVRACALRASLEMMIQMVAGDMQTLEYELERINA